MLPIISAFLKRALSIIRGLWTDDIGHRVIVGLALAVFGVVYTITFYQLGKASGAEKVRTKIERQIVRETGKETVRRETVLERVQVRSRADITKIDQLATKLAALQQESAHASKAMDDVACLPADSVLRLSAVH